VALQALFELDTPRAQEHPAASVLDYRLGESHLDASSDTFARQLVEGVVAHREELDLALQAALTGSWPWVELGRVERTVLRMAAYELLVAKEVPKRVVLDESIELAKSFAGSAAGRFVNGVLARLLSQV
jgi:N utilization substance protein B